MTPEQAKYLETVPESAKGIMQRAFDGTGRAVAVKAFCLYCTGFDRKAIRDCTAKTCPLLAFRPFQNGENDGEIAAESSPNRLEAAET